MHSAISKYLTKPIHLTARPCSRRIDGAESSYEEELTIICEMDFGIIEFSIKRVVYADGSSHPLPLSDMDIGTIARQIPTLKRRSSSADAGIVRWVNERIQECGF